MNNTKQSDPTQDNGNDAGDSDQNDDGMFRSAQQPHLAEDGATPFSLPSDIPGPRVSSTNPQADTNVDTDEAYQEGLGSASGVTNQLEDSDWVEPIDEDIDGEDRHARSR